MTINFDLTPEEFMLLDGKCSPVTQQKIDTQKMLLGGVSNLLPVQQAILQGNEGNALMIRKMKIEQCHVCGKSGEAYIKKRKRFYLQRFWGYVHTNIFSHVNTATFCVECNEKHQIIEGIRSFLKEHNIKTTLKVYARKI